MKKANAVFEGGGVKAIGLLGALSVAEEQGYQWVHTAGTSAGAIIAALVAAGYTANALMPIMEELNYEDFKDRRGILEKIPGIGPALSLCFARGVLGIFEGKSFEAWLRGLLEAKGVRTFGDLRLRPNEWRGGSPYRLTVIAADISCGRLLKLPEDIRDYGESPDSLDIARAVRMSISLPFFFEPARVTNHLTGEVSYIIDGGVLSNFPIWLLDNEEGELCWPTFGFKLVDSEFEGNGVRYRINSPITLLTALFAMLKGAHDARHLTEQHFARTIFIPTLGVRATDFDISRERRQALFRSGQEAARAFFQKWDFEAYKSRYRRMAATSGTHGALLTLAA